MTVEPDSIQLNQDLAGFSQQSRSSGRRRNRASSPPSQTNEFRRKAVAKSHWSFKTATELSAALAAKKISAVELAQDAIGRIERHDGKINAICVRGFSRPLGPPRAAHAAPAPAGTNPLLA